MSRDWLWRHRLSTTRNIKLFSNSGSSIILWTGRSLAAPGLFVLLLTEAQVSSATISSKLYQHCFPSTSPNYYLYHKFQLGWWHDKAADMPCQHWAFHQSSHTTPQVCGWWGPFKTRRSVLEWKDCIQIPVLLSPPLKNTSWISFHSCNW